MAFFYFLLHEKSKIWKIFLSFQIYVPYDLKNQAYNIYKYRTYNRNLRVAGSDTILFQIYMDAPPGVPGVSKNQNFVLQINSLSKCSNYPRSFHKMSQNNIQEILSQKLICNFGKVFKYLRNFGHVQEKIYVPEVSKKNQIVRGVWIFYG